MKINLVDEALAVVEIIALENEITTTEAVRRAIAIAKFVSDREHEGFTFYIEKKGGRKRERLDFKWWQEGT